MKKAIAIIFLAVLVTVAVWQTLSEKETKVGLEKGNIAPDYELTTLEGQPVNLSDLKGKKVILNFWATWCPPCKEEMPEMQRFHDQYSSDVTIVAVNFTVSEPNKESVLSFIQEEGYTFPVFFDEKNKANSGYEVLTYPTSYFLDEEGRIMDKVVGPMTLDVMKEKSNL
ncbi:TlpA disulfide reductase family protein [Bacillus kexueae]|uniref:TlpA disulfide reductase family protein n=1 Tax=Aeribacillus kexueae TaxID=2078952 RepID=UPI001FAFC8CD|nr:TlpA family protein disulfide reductase [Bacillus kexueae]